MKKLLCLLLALCMCFSLSMLFTACDDEPADQPPPEEPQEGQVLLNGVPLADYVIVYPEGDSDMEEAAGYFIAFAKSELSVKMRAVSDQQAAAEYEILLGNTNRDTSSVQNVTLTKDEYYIAPLGKSVWISGIFPTKMHKAIDNLLASFVKVGNDMCFELAASKKESDFSHVRIMSYNVWGGTNNPGYNVDEERIGMVLDLIEKYEPDIFGLQEVVQHGWRKTLDAHFGDLYASVGVGRYANGGGESCAIYYLKSKFECLESGTRWLSETPDVPGSIIPEGSKSVRIYTYAKLKEKATGKVLLHVNTHLDNSGANVRQAEILMEEIAACNTEGLPCIITGDFNFGKDTEGYKNVTGEGYIDSLDVANYRESSVTDDKISHDGLISRYELIDHIFVTNDIKVPFYQLCTEKYACENGEIVQPSDHRPVYIDCVLP